MSAGERGGLIRWRVVDSSLDTNSHLFIYDFGRATTDDRTFHPNLIVCLFFEFYMSLLFLFIVAELLIFDIEFGTFIFRPEEGQRNLSSFATCIAFADCCKINKQSYFLNTLSKNFMNIKSYCLAKKYLSFFKFLTKLRTSNFLYILSEWSSS